MNDEQKQQQRTFLRERYLRMLASLTGREAKVKMCDKKTVTCQLGPSDVEFMHLQVTNLSTPIGVLPHAMLRCADIISIHVADVNKPKPNACHIHARLFDHRSAIQGHVNFFAKEFEEKRGDREKIRLDQIQEWVSQSKEHTLPNFESSFAQHLAAISDKVKEASRVCKEIGDAENKEEVSESLTSQRAARKAAMSIFMEQQCVRSARVDQQFEENIKIFNDGFDELRDQLNQGIPFNSQTYYKFMALGKEFS